MEWTAGIDTSGGSFRAIVVRNSESASLELPHLVSGGLPRGGTKRKTVGSNLRTWQPVDATEYLSAFGLTDRDVKQNRHVVYEVKSGDLRIQVPALVLMRAFFRPTKYLLPILFKAQALDHVRFLNFSTTPPSVEFYSRTWRNLTGRYADVATPISWLSSFPSAIAFAASVHSNARDGRIAVSLPNAYASLSVWGHTRRRALMVTGAELLSLDATEDPLPWALGHTKHIYERATHRHTGAPESLKVHIPARPNGSVDLSDAEWDAVRPILLSAGWKPTQHDPRAVLDGILRKLVFGTGWKTTSYLTGSATHARYAYRRLS